jgi:hypothetical protein
LRGGSNFIKMQLLILLFLVNFLRTLFIIALVYYGIKLFTRYVLPLILDKSLKNMQQKMHEQQQGRQKPSRPKDEVTIEYNNNQGRNNSQNKGEYVDFEEIE